VKSQVSSLPPLCYLAAMRSILVALALLACAVIAEAQQTNKSARIGFLATVSPAVLASRIDAFRQGLRELGYIEGKNIVIEWRFAEGKADRLPGLAAELVRLKVDVIVTAAPPPTRAAKHATSIIPIVMAFDDDPVGSGFVASLARPGGNITGLSTQAPDIGGKQLELLKEIVPKLSRVAILGTSSVPGYAQMIREIEDAAKALGMSVLRLDVQSSKDIDTAFQTATKGRANAAIVIGSPVIRSRQQDIVALALKSRFPTTYIRPEFVEDGGLMTYGPSINDLFRRAATYVDKILKGRTPADLPVEQPMKFDFVINLKTAKQIGLEIPQWTLMKADRVIK
jgi:putative tryptophan/tyrosine transport system substrate-binding protein